jgi:hypothetical protein
MRNFTLAPEEDEPSASGGYTPIHSTGRSSQTTETQRVKYQFSLHRAGFEMRPWPGVNPAAKSGDSVAMAMRYLIDGKNHGAKGNMK